jgi:hypothetical protein
MSQQFFFSKKSFFFVFKIIFVLFFNTCKMLRVLGSTIALASLAAAQYQPNWASIDSRPLVSNQKKESGWGSCLSVEV